METEGNNNRDDKNERRAKHLELANAYKSFGALLGSSEIEMDEEWSDSREDNIIPYKTSLTPSVKSIEIEAATRKSLAIASKIEKDDEKVNTIQTSLAFLCMGIALIAGSIGIFSLLSKNEEGTQLKRNVANAIEKSNHMPLFLYAPGTSASIIPSALSSCLGLKEARLGDDITNADYITSLSLCNLPTMKNKKTNIKLFLILNNPILRIPLSFIEMKDPTSIFYDPRVNDLKFEEYITNGTLFEEDSVTKRLLCTQKNDKRKLTKYSLERAKEILQSSEIGLFKDHYDSFIQFKNAFQSWNFLSSPIVDECMKEKFRSDLKHVEELYRKHGTEFRGYIDTLKETSKFDMELYAFTGYS